MSSDTSPSSQTMPRVPEDATFQEEEYEEPKWANLQSYLPGAKVFPRPAPSNDSAPVDNSTGSNTSTHSPSQTPRQEDYWFSSTATVRVGNDSELDSLPVIVVLEEENHRHHVLPDPMDVIDYMCFYALPGSVEYCVRLPEHPIYHSSVVWHCTIYHKHRHIMLRPYIRDIVLHSRLLPGFKNQLESDFPGYDLGVLPENEVLNGGYGMQEPPYNHQVQMPMALQDTTCPASPQHTAPVAQRQMPFGRTVYYGKNKHAYVHAPSQHSVLQVDPLTGKEYYKDLKNIMILTSESLEPSLEALESELNANGWETHKSSCIRYRKGGPGSPIFVWRTFISFFELDHTENALEYLHRLGEHGNVKFDWVDNHKTDVTLKEKEKRLPIQRGRVQRIQQSFQRGVMA